MSVVCAAGQGRRGGVSSVGSHDMLIGRCPRPAASARASARHLTIGGDAPCRRFLWGRSAL